MSDGPAQICPFLSRQGSDVPKLRTRAHTHTHSACSHCGSHRSPSPKALIALKPRVTSKDSLFAGKICAGCPKQCFKSKLYNYMQLLNVNCGVSGSLPSRKINNDARLRPSRCRCLVARTASARGPERPGIAPTGLLSHRRSQLRCRLPQLLLKCDVCYVQCYTASTGVLRERRLVGSGLEFLQTSSAGHSLPIALSSGV